MAAVPFLGLDRLPVLNWEVGAKNESGRHKLSMWTHVLLGYFLFICSSSEISKASSVQISPVHLTYSVIAFFFMYYREMADEPFGSCNENTTY